MGGARRRVAARHLRSANLRWARLETGGTIHPRRRRANTQTNRDSQPHSDCFRDTFANPDCHSDKIANSDEDTASFHADAGHRYPITSLRGRCSPARSNLPLPYWRLFRRVGLDLCLVSLGTTRPKTSRNDRQQKG